MYFTWSSFFIGLFGAALGAWIVKESFYLNHHVLFLGWVEQKWGPGMGTTAYKLMGVILIIFCLFVAFGQINIFGNPYAQTPTSGARTQIQNVNNNNIIAP